MRCLRILVYEFMLFGVGRSWLLRVMMLRQRDACSFYIQGLVVVCEPQEMQVVSVVWVDVEAVKHLLDITGEGNFFLSESGQDANQGIELVQSLKQVLV